jgi:hypothetical protein
VGESGFEGGRKKLLKFISTAVPQESCGISGEAASLHQHLIHLHFPIKLQPREVDPACQP